MLDTLVFLVAGLVLGLAVGGVLGAVVGAALGVWLGVRLTRIDDLEREVDRLEARLDEEC